MVLGNTHWQKHFLTSSVVASFVAVAAQGFMCTSQPLVDLSASCNGSLKQILFVVMIPCKISKLQQLPLKPHP